MKTHKFAGLETSRQRHATALGGEQAAQTCANACGCWKRATRKRTLVGCGCHEVKKSFLRGLET